MAVTVTRSMEYLVRQTSKHQMRKCVLFLPAVEFRDLEKLRHKALKLFWRIVEQHLTKALYVGIVQ